MSNRKSLRIENGNVVYETKLLRFGKKSKKQKEREKKQKSDQQNKIFNPLLYYKGAYGATDT